MTYDESHAQVLRQSLSGLDGITEKQMFGGICFLLNGNMLCGVHKAGGMARVGKELEAAALELDGVTPLSFTGRKMGGLVELTEGALLNDSVREVVLSLALEFVGPMPRK